VSEPAQSVLQKIPVNFPEGQTEGPFPGYVEDKLNDLGAGQRCSIFSIPLIATFLRDIPGKGQVFSTPKKDAIAFNSGASKTVPNQDLLFK
jgi:hypothetical protein